MSYFILVALHLKDVNEGKYDRKTLVILSYLLTNNKAKLSAFIEIEHDLIF